MVTRLVLACFFLSGFASLIYEVVWTRMMVLVFGATTLAVSTVLTLFMGGLALGSLVFGRTVTRWGHPLLVYAILELVIGCLGLLVPRILPLLVPLYQTAWQVFHQDFYLFSLARFVMIGLVLLLPTTLMGATLPVLSQHFSDRRQEAGRSLGLLYGINTLGAVMGTFSTGYVLLPSLGLHQSTLVAALSNFAVAFVSLIAWKKTRRSDQLKAESSKLKAETTNHSISSFQPSAFSLQPSTLTTRTACVVLTAFALSGFTAMVYEVTWSRALSLVLGSTLYAFSAMLTTFLVGLALGSLISARVAERLLYPLKAMGVLQGLIGLSAFFTLTLIGEMPYLFVAGYARWLPSTTWIPLLWFVTSFLAMFIPTLLLGMLFPLVVTLFRNRSFSMGRLAGDVYAVNTLGAIVGAFSAGFILIPALGIQSSMMVAVYLNLALGFVLLFTHHTLRTTHYATHGWLLASGFLALGIFMAFDKPTWNARMMTSGVFMHLPVQAEVYRKEGRQGLLDGLEKDRETVFYKEGITATVTVEKDTNGRLAMRINGRREAGDHFLRTQVLLGHLPLIFKKPESPAEQVLVIGWGSGVTAGSVAQHPVRRIVGVELEPAIVEASHFFEQSNHHPLTDPRVQVVVNDGRNYLLVTPERFDVIISQPSLPWVTGASSLFTKEFFQLGADRLKEGGIFCQWISGDTIALEDVRSVVKAFRMAFSSVWIFQTVPGDLVLLGSNQSLGLEISRLQSILAREPILKDLKRIRVETLADFLSLYLFRDQEVDRFAGDMGVNTDNHPIVETMGPVHYYARPVEENRAQTHQHLFVHVREELARDRHPLAQQANSWEVYMEIAKAHQKNNMGPLALFFVDAALSHRETAEAHYLKAGILWDLADYLAQAQPGDLKSRQQVVQELIDEYKSALKLGLAPAEARLARFDLGGILFKEGKLELAASQYRAILATDPISYEAHSNLGAVYLQMGRWEEALAEYQQALKIDPKDPQAHFKRGLILSQQTQFREAIDAYERALTLAPNYLEAHFNLALAYELSGEPEKAIPHYQHFLKLAPQDAEHTARRNSVEARIRTFETRDRRIR